MILSYTIDDEIESPLLTSVEVTIDLPEGKRWLCFVTPELLGSVGDFVQGTNVRMHLGEKHVITVSQVNAEVIESVLQQLKKDGELESRTLPLI